MFLKKNKTIFALFILFFSFCSPFFSQDSNVTTITITKARATDYVKDKETNNDCIVLKGDVHLSVKKGSNVTEISSDTITYDRNTQMLYANGNINIVTKSEASGEQKITATSLIMNTATLEGVFDGGKVINTQSDAINLPAGSTLVVFSELFGKSDNNTIVFKNSSLTFCDDENPHWHIDASRTWLLPGGEFAFLNALLYVGPIPVLYFPAFYYPKDELVFNPYFGFRQREGYYFQTTTYLYGRKNISSNTSSLEGSDSINELYNFMKATTLKDQERQGLMLHNLDKNFSGDTSHYVKLMADWYSNLGFMIGLDGKLEPKKIDFINTFDFNLSLAFSKKINGHTNFYTPFDSQMNVQNYETNFLGLNLPFRYKANIDLSLSKPFNIKLSLPLYSDPYFNSDFENRNETLDWISLLTTFGNEELTQTSVLSSFDWKLSASHNFSLPQNIKPYISSASIQAYSSMSINSKNGYFFPSIVTPISASASLSGTLYKYPSTNKSNQQSYFMPLVLPSELSESQNSEKNLSKVENVDSDDKGENQNDLQLSFTELNPTVTSYALPSSFDYNLTYSFSPSYINQFNFNLDKISNPSDFNWKDIKAAMYTLKTPLSLNSTLSYDKDFFKMTNAVFYTPVWQKHTKLPENETEKNKTEKNNMLLSDYRAQNQNIVNKNSIVIKPFNYLPFLTQSSLSYNTSINLFRTKFEGSVENPVWQYFGPDFTDSASFTTHNVSLSLVSSQNNDFSQNLVITSTLYPQVPDFQSTLNLTFPYVKASIKGGVYQKSKEDTEWKKSPLSQNLNISLFSDKLKINQSYVHNLQEKHPDSLKISASYNNLNVAYIMSYTTKYEFDSNDSLELGWVSKDKDFIPYSFSLSYNLRAKEYLFWFDRISFSPSLYTSLTADLVRPTYSNFEITPSLSFKINNFLTITFSSTSKNSVLYRYVQSVFGDEGLVPGQTNPFIDLIDSFRFDDKTKRQNSGWKLKSLNLAVEHELHDWTLNMALKVEPRLVTLNNKRSYSYNPYFFLGITWKPMESMKTSITDEYGKWKFE